MSLHTWSCTEHNIRVSYLTALGLLNYNFTVQGLLEEATFYDKQWTATWEGQERPKESEA